jgi:sRNA-binding protein
VQYPDYSVANWKRTALSNRGQDRGAAQVDPDDEKPIPVREHLKLAQEQLKLNYFFWASSPKYLENVKKLLAKPDLANDPAGGLQTGYPSALLKD